ncbi:MAG: hypothetical protein IPN76_07440 [Saprospiraceae bacterium]|nr:hypothetical protein [Saprospiraceae bacterium]
MPGSTPFTLNQYYASPLNRDSAITPPSWYPTFFTYGSNLQNNVVLDHAAGTWYGQGTLFVATAVDPNGNKAFTFKDKRQAHPQPQAQQQRLVRGQHLPLTTTRTGSIRWCTGRTHHQHRPPLQIYL